MKLLRHGVLSQRPPLHHSSSSSSFNIVDTLKMTKSRRRSRSNLTAIDFDSIDVRMSSTSHHLLMVMLSLSCLQ